MKYQLPYGRFIPESEVSNHHINWRRKDYKTALDKAYRSNLILPLHNKIHTELHRELYPPPKPSKELMTMVLDFKTESEQPYERFLEITEFLGNIAMNSWNDERADEAGRIHENYLEQDVFISKGYVRPVWNQVL